MLIQNIFDQLLIFTNLYQYAKNEFIHSAHSLDRVSYRFSSPDSPQLFWNVHNPTDCNLLLICMNLYQHAKNRLIFILFYFYFVFFFIIYNQLFLLKIQSILESMDQIGLTHFWSSPIIKILMNLYFLQIFGNMQKEAVSSICSEEIVDLKMQQSEFLREFWPIFQE